MSVHNHTPEEGPGLDCPEHRTPEGNLRGECMTRPALELTWYTCRECGDSSCFMDDEIPAKRLGNDELAVEWHRSAAVTAIHGAYAEGNRAGILHRFLTTPHAHESDYQ